MPLVVVPRHWSVRQLEAAIDALGDLRSSSARIDPGAFGERTLIAIAYEAMVSDGAERRFQLEPASDAEILSLAKEHGLESVVLVPDDRLLRFARAVEELHGIREQDIPF